MRGFHVLWHFKMEAKLLFFLFKMSHKLILKLCHQKQQTLITDTVWEEVKCSQTSLFGHTKGLIHRQKKNTAMKRHAGTFKRPRKLSRSWRRTRPHSSTWGRKPWRSWHERRQAFICNFCCGLGFNSWPLAASNWTKTTSDRSLATLSAGLVAETEEINSKTILQTTAMITNLIVSWALVGKLDSLPANRSRVKGQAQRSRRSEEIQQHSQRQTGPEHKHAL